MEQQVSFGVMKQGYMEKLGAQHKALRKRWMVLLEDRLVYSKRPDSDKPQGSVMLHEVIEAATATAYDIGRHRALQACTNVWKITTPKRTFFLVAETRAEMNVWIDSVRAALRGRSASANTTPDAAPTDSAVVVPL